ncbi:LacI family DNA-binding transcriptional regulator [Aliiroseovarius sp.]|uniref:LacI family DNA-binding transcriptional regulator n=1 Tax=Aliiroseovarius sp. TaxID=1872442 RepID=UPI003BACAFE9
MTGDRDETGRVSRRVTAQMVADAAGVSRSAVSRAFTEGAYLDAEKRLKIQEVATELGYKPNALAAGLQGGRSHLVAIFVGNMRSPYDTAFVRRLVGQLNARSKWPLLIDGGGEQAESAVSEVLRYPLDALILRGGSMAEEIVTRCAKVGIPMISSGRLVMAPGVDNVCCHNAQGMRMATEELLSRGRNRFALISGPQAFFSSGRRRAGLIETLAERDMTLIGEETGDYTVEGGYDAARRLFSNARPDALLCSNDAMAIGALTAAREMGLSVPGDMSVIGFDDIQMASWPTFNLSTVRNPIDASVDRIMELLERRLETPMKPAETVYTDPVLKLRGTH